MSNPVKKGNHPMDSDTISLISKRYKTITRAVNKYFWDLKSETANSIYVGSYGRGTAIGTSDLDVLFELPSSEYEHFASLSSNGPSRLLQTVKDSILITYPKTDVEGNGQVVVINFADGMKFEILPAFRNLDGFGNWDGTYKYPDTHMGGNWLSTNPKAEQQAMKAKNAENETNGLLVATCKHIRNVRAENFLSYRLSGILIDSFVYTAICGWHFLREGEKRRHDGQTYEEYLLDYFEKKYPCADMISPTLFAPGSGMEVNGDDWDVLGKVLRKMV